MSKNFNIKPDQTKFYIDENKRTVVCILNNTSRLFLDFVSDNLKITLDYIDTWSNTKDVFYDKLLMPNRFTGISKCSPNDEWNVEIGKTVAFSRMKDKIYRSFFKRANTYINALDTWVDDAANIFNALGDKMTENMNHRYNYIRTLVGEEPVRSNVDGVSAD